MAIETAVALSEYFETAYEPDAEYVDGIVEERPVGEYDHACWQRAIQKWFLQHEEDWNIRALAELRVQVGPTRYRVPDVTVLDHLLAKEQIVTHPPVAVFEVLSPEDRLPRVLVKLQDYERMGIKNIFVADPRDGSIWRFQHGELVTAESGALDGSPCILDWVQISRYVG